ncbi:DUF1330 domain-containing protein [Nocardia pneumoniae]|uniref:DUF1330 domain-containing protein n=1 Tax=Nocardia pneumoniae TaxID=228601 RepID=UPI00278BE854|nr:DUF1330 domain-containing protein [Nocardia pneumoniae]
MARVRATAAGDFVADATATRTRAGPRTGNVRSRRARKRWSGRCGFVRRQPPYPYVTLDDGCYLVATVPEAVEGAWPGRAVVLEFPDLDRIRECYHSPPSTWRRGRCAGPGSRSG